jgi:hypothetical protein
MAHVFGADEVNAKLIRVARSSSPLLALTAAEIIQFGGGNAGDGHPKLGSSEVPTKSHNIHR